MVAVAPKIILSSEEPLDVGKSVSVLVSGRKKRLKVQPESCRPLPEGGYLVVAQVLNKDYQPHPQDGERRDVRVPERVRAMSPELPSYRAVTLDCSPNGIQLETDAPLTVGEELPLELSLLDHGQDMPCRVRVCWCQTADEKTYRSGCEFVEASEEFRLELRELLARHPEYARPPRIEQPTRLDKPLPRSLPEPIPMTEVMTEAPEPIPLVEEQVPEPEEQAPLDGFLVGFEAEDENLTIKLLTEGEFKAVELDRVVSLSDYRGRSGTQIAFLSLRQMPGLARIRFLNPWREKILEVETRHGYAWSA